MSTTTHFTPRELMKLVDDNDTIDKINEWLARGDGIAVYEDRAFDSSTFGRQRFFPFGSSDAQFADVPPERLPDFPGEINWRYTLVGTYRGDAQVPHVPTPDEEEWHDAYEVARRIIESFTGKKYEQPANRQPFTARLSSRGFEVRRVVDGWGNPTEAQRFEVRIKMLNPSTEVKVQSWLYDEGINVVAPFDWIIIDDAHGTRTGTDPNLGGAIVSVYNNCLPPKEGT